MIFVNLVKLLIIFKQIRILVFPAVKKMNGNQKKIVNAKNAIRNVKRVQQGKITPVRVVKKQIFSKPVLKLVLLLVRVMSGNQW